MQSPLLLDEFITKKEQTLFARTFNQDLPVGFPVFNLSYLSIPKELQLLVHVLTHEIGHLIDFSNQINRSIPTDCDDNFQNCSFEVASAYGLISFNEDQTWRESASFYHKMPCYYQSTMGISSEVKCDSFHIDEAESYYRAFVKNKHFISPYAAVNPIEDFAEMVSFELLDKASATSEYSLQFNDEDSIDLSNKTYSALYAKREFLTRILNDLKTRPSDRVF